MRVARLMGDEVAGRLQAFTGKSLAGWEIARIWNTNKILLLNMDDQINLSPLLGMMAL